MNIVKAEKVNFLDLEIKYNEITQKLKFSLYYKPTNTFSYLRTDSNHPDFVFKNIPKSLFIRTKRICSDYSDFIDSTKTLSIQLLKRGYKSTNIMKTFNIVSNINRDKLLPYKIKENNLDFNSNLPIFINFNFNFDIKRIIMNSYLNLKKECLFLENYNIKCIFKINTNLNCLFIHGHKLNIFKNNYTKSCKERNCKVCKLIYEQSHLELEDFNFKLPLLSNANCKSKNLVYVIICTLCNKFYVGETRNSLKTRMNNHLFCIKRFKPFIKYNNEVSSHFNYKHHNLENFKVCVFKDNLEDDAERIFSLGELFFSMIFFFSFMSTILINNY